MKEKTYTGIKIASCDGKFFRIITQPLSPDEEGCAVMIITNRQWNNTIILGRLISVASYGLLVQPSYGPTVLVNPDVVVGWTSQRLYHEDITNPQFQSHPEQFCVPGSYSPEGTQV